MYKDKYTLMLHDMVNDGDYGDGDDDWLIDWTIDLKWNLCLKKRFCAIEKYLQNLSKGCVIFSKIAPFFSIV